ncbi:MAG: rhodanese-like domain-containing protein [Phycisphaerales bacterium]|nr:rhodanese-like domain-containing protein [Phycisphaerales bacterium]
MACCSNSGGSTWLRAVVLVGMALGAGGLHMALSDPISTELKGSGVVVPTTPTTTAKFPTLPESGSGSGPKVTAPEAAPVVTRPTTEPATNTPTDAKPPTPETATPNPTPITPAPAPVADAGGQTMLSTDAAVALFNDLQTQFVDAREPDEFGVGRIPSAVSLPVSAFNGQNAEATEIKINMYLRRDLNVVVYCGGGQCDASKLVAKNLQARAFSKVAVYHDGMTGWTAAGLPTESGPENPPGLPRMPVTPPSSGGTSGGGSKP